MIQYSGFALFLIFNQLLFATSELTLIEDEMNTFAVGATALFSASYERETSASYEILDWRLNITALVRFVIEPDGNYSVVYLDTNPRLLHRAELNAPFYNISLEISNLQFNDSGTLDINRNTPSPSTVLGTFMALNVKECDSNSIEDGLGINVAGIGSHSYNYTFEVDCVSGFVGSVNLTCQANATWLQEGSCEGVTTATAEVTTVEGTTTGVKTRETGGMSEGDVAGTVLTCIFILECICLCVFVFALNYALSPNWLIGLYVAGICFSIIGIFMCFFGSSTAGTVMNSVEIAGTVLGSVGITVMLGGIVMQAWKGVGSKDYAAGEPPK